LIIVYSCRAESDLRPGLIKSHAEKRTFQALKRKQEVDEIHRKKNPNVRLLESERRKEGMEKAIDENNRGFALLQKMGYKPGRGLGRKGKNIQHECLNEFFSFYYYFFLV